MKPCMCLINFVFQSAKELKNMTEARTETPSKSSGKEHLSEYFPT